MGIDERAASAAAPPSPVAAKLPVLALRFAGAAVLLAQAAAFVFVQTSRPHWVHPLPGESSTRYRLFAQIGETSLSAREVETRYGLPRTGRSAHTPEGLRAIVRAVERDRRDGAAAIVRLHTRRDAGKEEVWLWPEN